MQDKPAKNHRELVENWLRFVFRKAETVRRKEEQRLLRKEGAAHE
jgi:hypothetical protein